MRQPWHQHLFTDYKLSFSAELFNNNIHMKYISLALLQLFDYGHDKSDFWYIGNYQTFSNFRLHT